MVISPFRAAAGPFQPSQRAKDPIGLSFVEPNQMTAACTDEARRAESRERGRMRSPSAGAETASWRADAADSSVPPRLARPWRGMEVRLARAALVLSHAKRSRVTASDTNCEPKAAVTARKAWSASSRRSIKGAWQAANVPSAEVGDNRVREFFNRCSAAALADFIRI